MNRLRWDRHTKSIAALVVTLPLTAILCRGFAPKPYDPINIPFWERSAPQPVKIATPIPARPFQTVLTPDSGYVQKLMSADEDRLLAPEEQGRARSGQAYGAVGDWLMEAARISTTGSDLEAKQDRIALRLVSAQNDGGYFGASSAKGPSTASDYQGQIDDLRGLIAYFRKTRSPIVVLTMLHAGDYLMSLPVADPKPIPVTVRSRIALPLVELYLQTGERKYLDHARDLAANGCADIPGLCALYTATDNRHWLKLSEEAWKAKEAAHNPLTPDDAIALYRITLNPKYLANIPGSKLTPDLEFSRTAAGIIINPLISGSEYAGKLHLSVDQDASTRIVVTKGETSEPLSLSVLPLGSGPVTLTVSDHTGKISGVHSAKSGAYIRIRRVWHPGDVITLSTSAPTTIPRTI